MANRIIVYRLAALPVLFLLFYALDWMPLRVAQRDAVAWSLERMGYAPAVFVQEGSPAVKVGNDIYFFLPECTYVDLYFMVAPFLWVCGTTRRANALRLTVAAVVVMAVSLVRVCGMVYFNVRGMEWFYTHDLPDYFIWWPTVLVCALLALRRDFHEGSEGTCNLGRLSERVLDAQ